MTITIVSGLLWIKEYIFVHCVQSKKVKNCVSIMEVDIGRVDGTKLKLDCDKTLDIVPT